MAYLKFLLLATLVSLHAHADFTPDKQEKLNGVSLESGKENDQRVYTGKYSKTFPYSLDLLKKSITNFTEKCNNAYKSKRQFQSQETDCKYHNEHLVESFVVKDVTPQEYLQNLSEYYLVGRQIYNRGSYGFYELVQIKNSVDEQKRKVTDIRIRMLNDDEVKLFTTPKFKRDSAFDHSAAHYTLTEITPQKTTMTYEYSAQTDNWILNKEIAVPQVFASISKSMLDFMKSVEMEASFQKRELASQN